MRSSAALGGSVLTGVWRVCAEIPGASRDRWGLRKRVWRERRDSERVFLEQRERALFEQADELSGARHASCPGWLRELCELTGGSALVR